MTVSGREYYTIAEKNQQQFSVIHWKSQNFQDAGYSPQRRCIEVAPRFQNDYRIRTPDGVTYAGTFNRLTATLDNPPPANATLKAAIQEHQDKYGKW
ncbi:MAG: hypothetical protein J7647_12940 [Cyanobacteria bacterium SBLK]|nr:hypothetical protein [Cyanobacteria bacterium SBLK]